ncbi:alpha-glucosidase [Rubrimonas cliftonensis]|uniref:Alpha-glucosidase n=1 Tax=Rubrimonas cliftonensis TaxID=89524 RepID=A0A1H3WR63_9RHOB|nr:alpha-glucosidase [Rubrimonas cliftonensis]SDZ88678.1 alpha-glucosidase [Rubrimonas cliftonensis]
MFVPPAPADANAPRQLGGDPDWWRGGVIYQIYPRSFLDMNGDGVGDLAGVAARLDYIASLGVDAIWISPFFTSPMKDFGYDVADYRDVDPMFGTLEDFDALLDGAHRRGVRVMLDLVLSHTSDKHPWFQESRIDRRNARHDWYVWADPEPDGTPPTNWLSIFGGSAWEWESRRRQYYLHNFLTSQPDLNFHNPDVQEAMLDVARFWLERGVDGFRLDTANMYFHDAELRNNPPIAPGMSVNGIPEQNPYSMQQPLYNINRPENLGFMERLRALMDRYPGTASVGEVGAVTNMYKALEDYTAPGRLHMAYSFDYLNDSYSAAHVRRVSEGMARQPDNWPSWAFSNHDNMRVLSRWRLSQDPRRAGPMLTALLTSLRGSPCLYQGEELALTEAVVPFELLQDPYGIRFWPDFKGRDGCRTPMPWSASAAHGGFSDGQPWLPMPPDHLDRAVDLQHRDPVSPLNRVRAFLKWRRGQPALLKGDIAFHDAPEPVVAFSRRHDGSSLLCVFNLGAGAASFDTGGFGPMSPLGGHGFGGAMEGAGARLGPFDAFFAAYQ